MAVVESIQNIFRIPELKRRILFTIGMFVVYRLGVHVPSPGVDAQALTGAMEAQSGTLFGLYDIFVGGAFSQATVFALGIMPYISASIILQVLGAVVPYLEKLRKEGEEGQKKINQLTRYGTVLISLVQSYAYGIFLMSNPGGVEVVPNPGIMFVLTLMITQTAGTIFVMWLGEQITERGIGNGISLIIFINIIGEAPNILLATFDSFRSGSITLISMLAAFAFLVALIAFVVVLTQGTRKIPVQYAKRIVGRRMYGGASTFIPLRVNTAGVIPIIFASSILILPTTIAQFFPDSMLSLWIQTYFAPGTNGIWEVLYALFIIFFTYFYTAVVLNPNDLAESMRKNGGFIPGIRPGRKTAEYIDRVLTRITLVGAVGLAAVAIMPDLIFAPMGVPLFSRFGGTSVLIVVGVALDTLQQIESHLLMRHYEGFVRQGRIRGRRG
jgi:preprotein translocase subunit SecY